MGTVKIKRQFDFEKSYLCDVLSWSSLMTEPDILVNKFQDTDFDGEIAYSVLTQLDSIIRDTRLVREGMFCGHQCRSPHEQSGKQHEKGYSWETNTDGRIWSALDLTIEMPDLPKKRKLSKLLKSELDLLERQNKYRQAVVQSFQHFDRCLRMKASSHKNLFKEGQKLDERVNKYRAALQKEMILRRMIVNKISRPSKGVSKIQKRLLEGLVTKLRQFVTFVLEGCDLTNDDKDVNRNNIHQQCLDCKEPQNNQQAHPAFISDDTEHRHFYTDPTSDTNIAAGF